MRRQASDYREHYHGGGRDPHHHHHHLAHHHGPGGGGGSATGQAPPPPLHHHHHQQPHHAHHRQGGSHFHHPIQHRSSSSSQLQHIRPSNTNQSSRHRSRTSSLSMSGLDGSPMPGPPPPPPPPQPSSSSNLPQLSQLDSRINDMNLSFGNKSSRDRLSSPLLPSHHHHNNPSPNPHHHHHPHHRRSYLGSSSGSSGSSSGGSIAGGAPIGTSNNSSNLSSATHHGMINNNNNSSGNPSSALTSPSLSSAVLSRLERKKRLLACLDGGTAPPLEDGVSNVPGDRLNPVSGVCVATNTNSSSRASLSNPTIATHANHNGLNDHSHHGSFMNKSQPPSNHHHQGSFHSSPHHHPSGSGSNHRHQPQHHSQHHHHSSALLHHNASNSSSASKTPTHHTLHQRSPMNSSNLPPKTHQNKPSSNSSVFSSGSPLSSHHTLNNNNHDNISMTASISTNDLNRRTSYLPCLKSNTSNTNNIDNNSISTKKESMQASNSPSPLSTPHATQRSNSISSVTGGSISVTTLATLSSAFGTSDRPKKTSSSYLLPNSIYNKAGPGQKSSTLSTYTQVVTKGEDSSRVIDLGSQLPNSDVPDPRLNRASERIGSVLTTITNNEDYLITTKINSLLDDHINMESVTSSELSRLNKLKDSAASLADSTTNKIDDQGSSEVSSSSDADPTKTVHKALETRPTMTAAALAITKNIISKKSVMSLPLPKFACTIQASETAIIKKLTPDRELTAVSSSNKLLLSKTPLISLSNSRNHLSPSSLATFTSTAQTPTAVTPMVDYSKFNIRKKSASASMSSLDHASMINAPSASASSDDEKTSPMRADIDASHQSLDDSEEHSISEKTINYERPNTPTSPITERKSSIDSNESLRSPDIRITEKHEPQNVIKRRVSADDKLNRRPGSMSPQKDIKDKMNPFDSVIVRSKPSTPDVKPRVSKSDTKEPLEENKKEPEQRVIKNQKVAKPEMKSKPVKPVSTKTDKATRENESLEEKKKLSSIVAKDLGSSDSSSRSSSSSDSDDDKDGKSDESSGESSSSVPSSPRKTAAKETKKPLTTSTKKVESKKMARKKFELNHRERMQAKSKDATGKNRKLKVDKQPSSKIKGVTKKSIKNRTKGKSNTKARGKSNQKKSSLFDFDFEEPIYLSMYDKVKARSSANHTVTPPVNTSSEPASTSSKDTSTHKESFTKDERSASSKKSSSKEAGNREVSAKEPAKQTTQKRQAKLTKPRPREDSASSDSDSEHKPEVKENKRDLLKKTSKTINREKGSAAPLSPVKTKQRPMSKTKKPEKKFLAKNFVLGAGDSKSKYSPSRSSSSASSSSSLSSSSSSSSSSASSASSLASSSSENEEDEDAELSAIVAETAGRIGDEINVIEAANSPQLSPPPSPMCMENSFSMKSTEQPKPATNVDEIMARSSDSWSNLVTQPLHIAMPQMTPHSVANTPSPRKSGPSELVLSSPSICTKSVAATPECSPGARQALSLPSESSNMDNRCETEQAISTLLLEMDTDSISEQQLSVDIDTRTSISNQSPSPRKSPIKICTPPLPTTPSPPILHHHSRHLTPPTPATVAVQTLPKHPPPELSPVISTEQSIPAQVAPVLINTEPAKTESSEQLKIRTPSPTKLDQPLVQAEISQTLGMKEMPELPPLQSISIPSPTQHVSPQSSSQLHSPSKNQVEPQQQQQPCKLVSEVQSGKHALKDEVPPSADDLRPDVKRVRRNRKKSQNTHINTPTSINVNTPKLSAGQQQKMSPYDIFEFRDSDDEESSGKTSNDSSNVSKTPEHFVGSNSAITPPAIATPISKVASPPISSNLLQTVAPIVCASMPPKSTSPKLPLNLAQPPEAVQKTPPQPAVSPSGSSNENKDPAPKADTTPQSAVSTEISTGLLQTVDLKTEILKSLPDSAMKLGAAEETLESIEATLRQREREYVTELNQDGKLSLTIRKAPNQVRESHADLRATGKHGSTSSEFITAPESDSSNVLPQPSAENQAESNKSTTPQPGSANVKPTRRSARLMQTTKKEPTDDEQQPAKESTLPQPASAKGRSHAASLTAQRDSTLSVTLSDNQPHQTTVPSKEPTLATGQEARPPISGDQVVEPPVKTRRVTRAKKGSKQQQQQQSQPERLQPTQQPLQTQQQPSAQQLPPTLINSSDQTLATENQQSTTALSQQSIGSTPKPDPSSAVPAKAAGAEGRRPKRLTRLAAKTFGGAPTTDPVPPTASQQTTNPQQIVQPQQTAGPSQDRHPPQAPIQPHQDRSMHITHPTMHQPNATQQAHCLSPFPKHLPPQPSQYTSSSINEPAVHVKTSHTNDENAAIPAGQPNVRVATPIVDSVQPMQEKGALFCIPSYLPPRKRLGWIWSQKQLLEQRYQVVWISRFTLKDSFAALQMHFISGNNRISRLSQQAMLDETGMLMPIQINQRMRLEPDQLDGVQRKLSNEEDHCVLLATPVGRDQSEYLKQSSSMKVGFIDYLTSKDAAGIVYVHQPGETQPSYIIHIFPSCAFVNDHILQREPDLLSFTQTIDNLIVVITTAC